MRNMNWETTQLPKLTGGLGIGNFQHQNLALLAKWIWRVLNENNAYGGNLLMLCTMRLQLGTVGLDPFYMVLVSPFQDLFVKQWT